MGAPCAFGATRTEPYFSSFSTFAFHLNNSFSGHMHLLTSRNVVETRVMLKVRCYWDSSGTYQIDILLLDFALRQGVHHSSLMPTMKRCRSDAPSYARLNVFNRGVVWGMDLANASREEIQKAVTKKDGACPCIRALDSVIANMKQHPHWQGAGSSSGGRCRRLKSRKSLTLLLKSAGPPR